MNYDDLVRELEKIHDVMKVASNHFQAEALMNANLHMSTTVRPAPLATAMATATASMEDLIARVSEGQ